MLVDTDMNARIRGVAAQMTLFDFFYGLVLGDLLLQYSDNLSRVLQHIVVHQQLRDK